MPFLQHMGFHAKTENTNVMMREDQNTQYSEYILIFEDVPYNMSTTPEEFCIC